MMRKIAAPRRKGAAATPPKRRATKSAVAAVDREPAPKSARQSKRIEARRTAILDAGLMLFSRQGLHGTSSEEVAEAADVSKTNLFYYFRSKEDVYVEVLRRLLDGWLAPLRALDVADDPAAAIGTYIRRKVEFSRANPEASRLFCLEIVRGAPLLGVELRTALKDLVEAKAEVIRAWVAAGALAPVDPHHLIFAIWSTTQHYADFASQIGALLGRGLEDEAFFEETVANISRIVLDGVRPRGDHRSADRQDGSAARCT